MSRFQGRLQTLDVSTDGGTTFTAVLCIADGNFNGEGEEIDDTCHDDGRFRSFQGGRAAATIDVTGRRDRADPGQNIIRQSWLDGTKLDYRWRQEGAVSTAEQLEAQGLVTAFTETGPNDDSAGLDYTIRLSGTISESAVP